MQRLSSNLTLFFKLFVPVFWLAFFGAFVIIIFVYGSELPINIPLPWLRWGSVIFYLSGLLVFYFLLFPLKRVEASEDFLYVTNYFKTARYPWHNVERLEQSQFAFLQIVTVVLKTPGVFGGKMRFVASNKLFKDAKAQWPVLQEKLRDGEKIDSE